MTKRNDASKRKRKEIVPKPQPKRGFHVEYMNQEQENAHEAFKQFDCLFLLGPAGTAKTHLSTCFALSELLDRRKKKVVLTRPIVEAGEKLGFLPGVIEQKVHPYMLPIYDILDDAVGYEGPDRDRVNHAIEIAPLSFMRGRTFKNAVCILDESQNATYEQLVMFLSRMGKDTKLIVNGDPRQSDLPKHQAGALIEVVNKLRGLDGVGIIEFTSSAIVRHPLVGSMLERL